MTPKPLADQRALRRHELQAKLTSLSLEFDYWRTQIMEGAPLAHNHSQIERILRRLAGAQAGLAVELTREQDWLGRPGRIVQRAILELHHIWHFFRSKLALRAIKPLGDFLSVADELAWACYQPARDRAVAVQPARQDALREPPLTFFTAWVSPFMLPRTAPYQAEPTWVDDDAEHRIVLNTELVREVLIPVIGLPWHQTAHLPEMLAIAHEVGHAIEKDCRLSSELALHLGAALDTPETARRLPAWRSWASEIFADLWGVLSLGPAFAQVLMNFLASDPTSIQAEPVQASGRYPLTYLRILVSIEILKQQFHVEAADALQAHWRALYAPPSVPLAAEILEFARDIPQVVSALLRGPYALLGGVSLPEVLSFSPADHAAVEAEAERLLFGLSPGRVTNPSGVRVRLAAVAWAFARKPAELAATRAQEIALADVIQSLDSGVRKSGDGERQTRAGAAASLDDEKASRRLLQAILTVH